VMLLSLIDSGTSFHPQWLQVMLDVNIFGKYTLYDQEIYLSLAM
jgi:hypothetical protein